MISPTGIIPESLMYPQRKREVINFLLAQALPGALKRRLLEGWAVTVGVRVRSREYQLLDASGDDPLRGG
jgi:hypothetical protein